MACAGINKFYGLRMMSEMITAPAAVQEVDPNLDGADLVDPLNGMIRFVEFVGFGSVAMTSQ
jgi:hypothetical protein